MTINSFPIATTDASSFLSGAQAAQAGAEAAQAGAEVAQAGAEAARDAAIAAGAWDYTPADNTALAAITGMTAGQTALVVSTMHLWAYDGTNWNDTGESPIAVKLSTSEIDGGQNRSGIVGSIKDAAGFAVIGWRTKDGAQIGPWARGVDAAVTLINSYFSSVLSKMVSRPLGRSGVTFAVTDPSGRRALWVRSDGHTMVGRRSVNSALDNVDAVVNAGADNIGLAAALPALLRSSNSLVCWGDSLTEGAGSSGGLTYPGQLATLIGRTVSNRGYGGQSSTQIAGRIGGEAVLLTFSSGAEIPATGTVTLAALPSPNICYSASGNRTISGWVRGVAVTLTGTTLTRVTAGDTVPVMTTEIFTPDTSAVADRTAILWLGRNDGWTTDNAAALVARYERIIETMPPLGRWLILDVLNNSYEPTGTDDHTNIVAANVALRTRWRNRVIPIREMLIAEGLTRAGLTATTQDVTDVSNDVIPTSLRSDSTHLNNTGYGVVAEIIAEQLAFMETNQWL